MWALVIHTCRLVTKKETNLLSDWPSPCKNNRKKRWLAQNVKPKYCETSSEEEEYAV